MSSLHYLQQKIAPGIQHNVEIKRVIAQGHTPNQRYRILELVSLGRCIELNGCIQSTEFDEAYYHESLIFPAFAFNSKIKRVLCFGGANGGVLNRLGVIPSLKEVVQVDIDPQLYALSRHYLPFLHWNGLLPFKHSLHFHANPYDWLHELSNKSLGKYDLVIADLPDSTGDSYVPQLFTQSFYQKVKSLLTKNGAFVTQSGHMTPLDLGFHLRARKTIESCFDFVSSYSNFVPSYGTPWSFLYASMNINPDKVSSNNLRSNLSQINLDILKYYDFTTHEHCFNLPKPVRKAISFSEKEIIDNNKLAIVDIANTAEDI